MNGEPSSRSIEMEFLRAFLNSPNPDDFVTKVRGALEGFSLSLKRVAGINGRPQRVAVIESWEELPRVRDRFWLPLSEFDAKKGKQYVYSPAVEDVIRNPKRGPFYILTWELLLGTVLNSLGDKVPEGPLGTLLSGAVASTVLTFDGIDNELSAMEYLEKLHETASHILRDTLKTPPEDGWLVDFYLRTAYQFTFDALSLWTSVTVKTVTWKLVPEEEVGRSMVGFLLKDPELNVGAFHIRGMDIANLVDNNRGKDLAEMAYLVTEAVRASTAYPRVDDSESWKMFR